MSWASAAATMLSPGSSHCVVMWSRIAARCTAAALKPCSLARLGELGALRPNCSPHIGRRSRSGTLRVEK